MFCSNIPHHESPGETFYWPIQVSKQAPTRIYRHLGFWIIHLLQQTHGRLDKVSSTVMIMFFDFFCPVHLTPSSLHYYYTRNSRRHKWMSPHSPGLLTTRQTDHSMWDWMDVCLTRWSAAPQGTGLSTISLHSVHLRLPTQSNTDAVYI